MKEGDKAYCKKTYIRNGNKVFEKNKSYTIFLIDDGADSPENWLYCEKNSMPNGYCGFIINGDPYLDFNYFDDYFISSMKELRKEKLKRINEK